MESKVTKVSFPLPVAPSKKIFLQAHNYHVNRIAYLPEKKLLACPVNVKKGAKSLRIFELDTNGQPMIDALEHTDDVIGVAAVGVDIFASIGVDLRVVTWQASTGATLGSLSLGWIFPECVSPLNASCFAIGTNTGGLMYIAHNAGRKLRVSFEVPDAHTKRVNDITAYGRTMCTASRDWSVKIWDAGQCDLLAYLPHRAAVLRVVINQHYIVTGSRSGELRVYTNGNGFFLTKIFQGLHSICWRIPLQVLGDHYLLSATNEVVSLMDIDANRLITRLKTPVTQISDLVALPDGRIAVCGEGPVNAVIVSLPEYPPRQTPMQIENMPNMVRKPKYELVLNRSVVPTAAPLSVEQKRNSRRSEAQMSEARKSKAQKREAPKSSESTTISYLMKKWKELDVRGEVVLGLHASDLASMIGAFMLHYDISLKDRFEAIKSRLSRFFLENDIHGDVLVGKYAVSEDELFKGLLLALENDTNIRITMGGKARLRQFISRIRERK